MWQVRHVSGMPGGCCRTRSISGYALTDPLERFIEADTFIVQRASA